MSEITTQGIRYTPAKLYCMYVNEVDGANYINSGEGVIKYSS